jgi:DNA-binding transcriptional MerR regulator
MKKDEYLIDELAEETGISSRTIRYYQQEGLLPKPVNRGKFAYYNEDHLKRLKLIQELKNNFLPLKEIREHLNSLNFQQVQALLESQKIKNLQQPSPGMASKSRHDQPSSDTALEYISRLLQTQSDLRIQEPARIPTQLDSRFDPQRYVAGTPSESWRRILIAPGVEIQIQEPLSPEDQNRLEELIKYARNLFIKK